MTDDTEVSRAGARPIIPGLAGWSPWTRRAPFSAVVLSLALMTIGWDRLFNIPVGPYNLKVPTVGFGVALVAWIVESLVRRRRTPAERRPMRKSSKVLLIVLSITLVVYVVVSVTSAHPVTALGQFMTVIAGAVIPLAATVLVIDSRAALLRALNAFIIGGVIAMAFGVYQLTAGIAGWPQGVVYTDISGGMARISSFLYESGYFGYYVILLLGAIVARSLLCGTSMNWWLLGATYVVLLLANTRAAFLTLPVFVAISLFVFRKRLRLRASLLVAAGMIVLWIVVAVLPSLVPMVPAGGSPISTGSESDETGVSNAPIGSAQVKQFISIADPHEAASNAPRLQLLANAWSLYVEHPLLGLGPGNLYYYAHDAGVDIYGATPNAAIVNNVYLQSLVDGGPLLLLAQVGLAVLFLVIAYRRCSPVTAALLSGWIAVALVAWVGTSYYWDIKIWAVAGLVLASAKVLPKSDGPAVLSSIDDDVLIDSTQTAPGEGDAAQR